MLRLTLSGTLLAALTLHNTALGADMPRIAVVGIHQQGADQSAVVNAIVEAIEASERATALPPDQVAVAIRGRERVILEEGLAGLGQENLATGKNLYNQAQTEAAIPVLESATTDLRLAMGALNDVSDLWEAWVYLGTSRLSEGLDTSEEAFRAAAALDPGREPSAALFPPDVVSAYQAARVSVSEVPASLEVSAEGASEIWVDGVSRGAGPLTLPGVPVGEHFVLAMGEERMAAQAVRVAASEGEATTQASLTLGEPTLGATSPSKIGRSRQIAHLYEALASRSEGVELVLLAGVANESLLLQLYSVADRGFSKSIEVPIQGSAEDEVRLAIPLLLNVVERGGRIQSTTPTAASLNVAENSELASMLLWPRAPTAPLIGETGKKNKTGTVLAVVGGVLLASGVTTGAVLLATPAKEPVQNGSVVVRF